MFVRPSWLRFLSRMLLVLALVGGWAQAWAAALTTTTTLTVSPSSVAVGTTVTLTAKVIDQTNSSVVGGTVNFYDGKSLIGSSQIVSNTSAGYSLGTATLKVQFGSGSHSLKAVFGATNTDQSSSSSTQALSVTGTASTSTVLTTAPDSLAVWNLTANVNSFGNSSPTGTVSIDDTTSGQTIATGNLPTSAGSFGYTNVQTMSAGVTPGNVVLADVNGDGLADLIVADGSSGSNIVSVLLNNGTGGYAAAVKYQVSSNSSDVAFVATVGDFNGDGLIDLAVGYGSGSSQTVYVAILLGKGAGTFGTPIATSTNQTLSKPSAIAVGDFNRDGLLDVALATAVFSGSQANNAGALTVMLGNGSGSFGSLWSPSLTFPPSSVLAADFNEDGILDIAYTQDLGGTDILLGKGDGTFTVGANVSGNHENCTTADINADGNIDLICDEAILDQGVQVSLGKGDGTFPTQKFYPLVVAPSGLTTFGTGGIVAGDINHDGNLDVVATYGSQNDVQLFLGNGDGTLQTASVIDSTASQITGLAMGNISGSGNPDLVTVAYNGTLNELLNIASQTVSLSAVSIPGFGAQSVDAVYSGGLSAASSTSNVVMLAGTQSTTTTTLSQSGGKTISTGQIVQLQAAVALGGSAFGAGSVIFTDGSAALATVPVTSSGANLGKATFEFVPGAGAHSIVASFQGTDQALPSSSNSANFSVSGTTPTTSTLVLSGSAGDYTLTATVTGSGAEAPTGTVSFLDQTNGNASLGSASLSTASLSYATSNGPVLPVTSDNLYSRSLAVADFNGDGKLDIVSLGLGGTFASPGQVFLNQGGGAFASSALPAQTVPQPGVEIPNPVFVTTCDCNQDGIPDIILVNAENGANQDPYPGLSLYLGKGDGTFLTPITLNFGNSPLAATVGDFNHDGIPDIAVLDSSSYETVGEYPVEILLGKGGGSFQSPMTYTVLDTEFFISSASGATVGSAGSIAVGDFNEDGNLDLVVAANTGVQLLLGKGDGTFQMQSGQTNYDIVSTVAVGDFNHDGHLDLALNDYGNLKVDVLLGQGNGNFATPVSYSSGTTSYAAAQGLIAADMNGDGVPDLVLTSGGSVYVLQGVGDGTFLPEGQQYSSTSFLPYGTAIGDFNEDGVPDIAFGTSDYISPSLQLQYGGVDLLYGKRSETATLNYVVVPGNGSVHQVVASYGGDTYNSPSTSSAISLTSTAPSPAASITISGLPTSVAAGSTQTVTVRALNSSSTIATGYTGTVKFASTDAQAVLPANYTFTAADNGEHVFSGVVLKTAGAESITVTDTTTATFTATTSTTVSAASAASISTVAGSNQTANVDTAFSTALQAKVTDAYGNPVSGLTVTFTAPASGATGTFIGGSNTATATTSASGVATAPSLTAAGTAGTFTVSASTNGVGTSASFNFTVTLVPDFSLAASPSAISIAQGATGTTTFTVTPLNGFNQAVSFACSGLPSEASCSFSPASVTPNGGPVNSLLTITTTAPTALLKQDVAPWQRGGGLEGSVAAALLFGWLVGWRKRRLAVSLSLFIVLGSVLLLPATGCGGGTNNSGGSTPSNPGTPTGTDQVTVTASSSGSGSTQHTATLTVTITP